jgi:hypothetical protein
MATPGARAHVGTDEDVAHLLDRHATLEQGLLDDDDHASNLHALAEGARILSAFPAPDGAKLWIITEADRHMTTILLPEEY